MISLILTSTDFSAAMTVLHFCFCFVLCHEPESVKPRIVNICSSLSGCEHAIGRSSAALSIGWVRGCPVIISRGSHHHSAVHHKRLASDVAASGAGQKQHSLGDVLRPAQGVERNLLQQRR